MRIKLLFVFAASLAFESAAGANILFFYPISAYSHRTAVEPLAHKLVERGHNVTFMAPVKATSPNSKIHEFFPSKVGEMFRTEVSSSGDRALPDRLENKYSNFMTKISFLDLMEMGCRYTLTSPDFKPWVEANKFDLFIMTHHSNKCGYAVARKMNASVIVMSATTFFTSEEDTWGFPLESSWLRRLHLPNVFTEELSFFDKAYNAVNPILWDLYAKHFVFPKLDQLIQEFYPGEVFPSVEEMEREMTSLFFINTHFSEDFARSLPPMVIPVGGMHCTDEHKPLPKGLEDFIQGAGDAGFIFVSFGSMVKMSKVPDHILTIFFDAIKDLKTRFIWRWDSEPPSNLPPNVLTGKWFPQQDLLAHPKIKGFISHGGLMSTQQAIFHAVPLIIIPIVYDQPFNAMRARHHGTGIHLELSELNTESFKGAILQLLEDKSYKERMKIVSSRFRDRPLSAVDTAVYWTEYVLRHKDMSHLKPLGMNQAWWKRRLLDVWLFLYTVLGCALLLLLKFLQVLAPGFKSLIRGADVNVNGNGQRTKLKSM